jgi:hypothetical protein
VRGEPDGGWDVDRKTVERALVDVDPSTLPDPEVIVNALFTDTFVRSNTDFPDFEAFLEHAGVDHVWAFAR